MPGALCVLTSARREAVRLAQSHTMNEVLDWDQSLHTTEPVSVSLLSPGASCPPVLVPHLSLATSYRPTAPGQLFPLEDGCGQCSLGGERGPRRPLGREFPADMDAARGARERRGCSAQASTPQLSADSVYVIIRLVKQTSSCQRSLRRRPESEK